jgi:hypothetical protein
MRRLSGPVFALSFMASTAAFATCSRSYVATSYPRWHFNENEWSYSGTHSTTQISNAAAAWNSAQSTLSIQQSGSFLDYLISDDDSIEPDVGNSSYTTHATSGCPGQQDSCGYCFDGTMIYQWTIKVNWGGDHGVTRLATLLGITSDQMFEWVMSHEFGHSLRLSEVSTNDCTQPTIMSNNEFVNCSPTFFTEQSCDIDNFNSAYSGWTTVSNSCVGCDGLC